MREKEISPLLGRLQVLLAQEGTPAYLVGGYVRDLLLGRKTVDIDIAIATNAPPIASKAAEAFGGKYVLLDEENGMARVVLNVGGGVGEERWHLDFSTLCGNIEADLARRDFTIDAMAIDLNQIADPDIHIIDPLGGRQDLEKGSIRAVSEGIFVEDPARLLRAVRLAAEFDFTIALSTEALIQQYSRLIARVPGERLREEFLRLLARPQAINPLRYLDRLGLLTSMIPELAATKGVEQPWEHCWDVFDHSLETVAAVEFVFRESPWQYGAADILTVVPWSDTLARHFAQEISTGSTRKVLVKLAGLLHDVAKPQTKSIEPGGRARFLGHVTEGAVMTVTILERLRFSNRETRLAESMVRHHLRPSQMTNKGVQGLPTRRAIYRYFRDTEEAGIGILFLALADYLATHGPDLDLAEWQQNAHLVEYILTEHYKQESVVVPPKLLDGHDLINIFGLSPGPWIGQILEALREAQAAGEVTTRDEALSFVRGLDHESVKAA